MKLMMNVSVLAPFFACLTCGVHWRRLQPSAPSLSPEAPSSPARSAAAWRPPRPSPAHTHRQELGQSGQIHHSIERPPRRAAGLFTRPAHASRCLCSLKCWSSQWNRSINVPPQSLRLWRLIHESLEAQWPRVKASEVFSVFSFSSCTNIGADNIREHPSRFSAQSRPSRL